MKDISLNTTIAAYIEASNGNNIEAIITSFKPEAVVVDEGITYRGLEEIRGWLNKTRAEYQFTLEALDAAGESGETIVTCLVTGTFPGSPVSLHFHFTIDEGKIAALTIVD